tara:strand:+ start:4295 stop:6622 length:2328 start_codon:yes stop_codon:yes gene_type:complete
MAQTQLTLTYDNHTYQGVSCSGQLSLAKPFCLTVVVQSTTPLMYVPQTIATLWYATQPGDKGRRISGMITSVESVDGVESDKPYWQFTIQSHLQQLANSRGTAVSLGDTVPAILQRLAQSVGISEAQCQWALHNTYPEKPYAVQAKNETQLNYWQRLLADSGIMAIPSFNDNGQEQLRFVDDGCQGAHAQAAWQLRGADNMNTAASAGKTFHDDNQHFGWPSPQHAHVDTDEDQPQQTISGCSRNPSDHRITYAGAHHRSSETAVAHADLNTTQWQSQQSAITLTQPSADDAQLGQVVTLNADNPLPHLITAIDFTVQQPMGNPSQQPDAQGFLSHLSLYPLDQSFHPHGYQRPKHPQLTIGLIESEQSTMSPVDGEGKFAVRASHSPHASADKPYAQATPPMRVMSHYAGPTKHPIDSQTAVGFRHPFYDGDAVLLSHLQGQHERPYVLGSLPHRDTRSPVTAANATQTLWRSRGQQELRFDDSDHNSHVRFHINGGDTQLHMQNDADKPTLTLASKPGHLHVRAGTDVQIHSKDDMHEQVGNHRHVQAHAGVRVTTDTGDIHTSSATDIKQHANDSHRQIAKQQLQTQSAEHLIVNAGQDLKYQSQSGNLAIHAQAGHISVSANQTITVAGSGQGDCHLHQSGSGWQLKPDGSSTLYGKQKLSLQGGTTLQGNVNQDASPISVSKPGVRTVPTVIDVPTKAPVRIGTHIHTTDDPTAQSAYVLGQKPKVSTQNDVNQRNNNLLYQDKQQVPYATMEADAHTASVSANMKEPSS